MKAILPGAREQRRALKFRGERDYLAGRGEDLSPFGDMYDVLAFAMALRAPLGEHPWNQPKMRNPLLFINARYAR